jgi:hypothetical protein
MPSSETLPPRDDEARGPCAGGLVAGTLALMTTWAAPAADAPLDEALQRELIARKIVANLALLRTHPDIGPALRQVIGKVAERWEELAKVADVGQRAAEAAPGAPTLPLPRQLH